MEEWEPFLIDPGHTRGLQTLFRQAIQQYWVMKNLLAKAMTTYGDKEEPLQSHNEEPSLKDVQKEIQVVQVQQYHQNLHFRKIEKQIQTLLQNEVPGLIAKDPTPIDSFDE